MRAKKTGRKSLLELDPKVVERLCLYLREGCSVRTACQASAVSETTFHAYNRRANPQHPDYAPEFAQFAQRTTRARGLGKSRLVSIVSKAATRDWRAAIELLRSIAPIEYASRISRDQFEALKETEQPEVVYLPQPETEITTSIDWRSLPLPLNKAQLRYIAGVQEQAREQGEQ
jgi:hypothetical protein